MFVVIQVRTNLLGYTVAADGPERFRATHQKNLPMLSPVPFTG
jgi:hypothetical protein